MHAMCLRLVVELAGCLRECGASRLPPRAFRRKPCFAAGWVGAPPSLSSRVSCAGGLCSLVCLWELLAPRHIECNSVASPLRYSHKDAHTMKREAPRPMAARAISGKRCRRARLGSHYGRIPSAAPSLPWSDRGGGDVSRQVCVLISCIGTTR